MKLYDLNKDTIPLTFVGVITFGFFIGGMCDVLDFFIVKVLLFLGVAIVFVLALKHAQNNEDIKNRPEDNPQDDLH